MSDMRRFISLFEKSETLLEAPFWQSAKSRGENKRKDLVKKMKDAWDEWLGLTGHEGTQRDMINFLISKVGFSKADTMRILDINSTSMVNSKEDESQDNSSESQESSDEKNEAEFEIPRKDAARIDYLIKRYPQVSANDAINLNAIDAKDLAKNIVISLKKPITSVQMGDIYKSIQKLVPAIRSFKDEGLLREIYEIITVGATVLTGPNTPKEYRITPSEYAAIANAVKKRIDELNDTQEKSNSSPANESIIYEDSMMDMPLSTNEIDEIFSDAAKYAYSNNLIGNKNYARNSSEESYSGQSSNSSDENKVSKPVEKANHLSDFASKVFNTAIQNGLTQSDRLEDLKALSKKAPDQITPDDYKAFAPLGWAFMRNLGK